MSLKYALLAMLTAEPLTGYEVYKRFQGSVGQIWHAPDSQIYPELRRMEAGGLLAATAVPWGPKRDKTRYSITEAGVGELKDWLREDLVYSRDRDPVRLKIAYLEWGGRAAAERHLERHLEFYKDQVSQWEAEIVQIKTLTSPALARRLSPRPEREWKRIVGYKVLAYEGLVMRGRAEMAWAEHGLRSVAAFEADSD